jgi:hypothetical protein
MKRRWILIACINFILATSIGALLRFAFVEEVSWLDYKNYLHAHSHVAMLGWIYQALYTLLIITFLPANPTKQKNYRRLFIITQISVVGMLISFPLQGYGPISITFSALHIICSYVFTYYFWSDLKKDQKFSTLLIKTALILMIVSTLGVWMMGPIMVSSGKASIFYYMSVQFFLHFQFNGWFLWASLALFFRFLESHQIQLSMRKQKMFYGLLLTSCALTYALAVAWAQPDSSVFFVNGVGVLLQLVALAVFLSLLKKNWKSIWKLFPGVQSYLLAIGFFSFFAKIIIQFFVIIPFIAEAAYTIRNYVIGFIHLILLGIITAFILTYALQQKLLHLYNTRSKLGLGLLWTGFVLSEMFLFLQGCLLWGAQGFLPFYYEIIFGVSVLMPLGMLIFVMGQFSNLSTSRSVQ